MCGSSEEDCHKFSMCTNVGPECTCNVGYIGDRKASCIGLKKGDF